jgi:L-phenylalanine/L-methionine N-acetyltransferase
MTINIRGVKSSDAEALNAIVTQPSSLRFLLSLPSRGVAYTNKWIADMERNDHVLVAEIPTLITGTPMVVGSVELNVMGAARLRHTAVFSISVKEGHQHQGVGTALMKAMIDLADNYLNLHRIEAGVLVDNTAAFGLYEKFGFKQEGIKRDCAFREGKYVDCAVIARLKGTK